MKKQLKKHLQLYKVICYTYPAIEQEAILKELYKVADDLDVSINQILLTENLDFSIQNKGLYLLSHFNSLLAGLSGWQAINLEKWLLTLVEQCQQEPNTYLILLDHQGSDLPRYLNSIIPTLIHELPSIPQIQDVIKQVFAEMGVASLDNEKMALAVSGLSLKEIELALKEAILQKGEIIENLIWQKQRFLQGLGLEFLPPPDVPTFGGLNRIKEAIEQVALDYSEEARQFKLPFPKGWLFAGPPGTGKTFGAKICAAKLGFPLISVGVDIVKSKGSNYLKHLLKVIEAASPVVCYFDEFDKFFDPEAAITGGGTTKETLGVLLTWFQEKTTKTFVIATLNRLDALPPELTRAGRFDRLFYVGFPQANERKEIIELHASRFDRRFIDDTALSTRDWRILLNRTQNCTGAELRAIAELAAKGQFYRGVKTLKLELDDFLKARTLVTPLYVRDTERVLAMANRAKGVCENASSDDVSIFAPLEESLWGD